MFPTLNLLWNWCVHINVYSVQNIKTNTLIITNLFNRLCWHTYSLKSKAYKIVHLFNIQLYNLIQLLLYHRIFKAIHPFLTETPDFTQPLAWSVNMVAYIWKFACFKYLNIVHPFLISQFFEWSVVRHTKYLFIYFL